MGLLLSYLSGLLRQMTRTEEIADRECYNQKNIESGEVSVMPEPSNKSSASGSTGSCLEIALRSEASHLRASDGREIPFTRAVLTARNACGTEAVDVALHAALGQEGGTEQDVSGAFAGTASSLVPGGSLSWDVYDRLLPAHQGTASKIHMFGYRAVLNWRFELTAWAEYRSAGSSAPVRTPAARWSLRWTVPDPATGAVMLTVEELRS